MKQIPRKRPQTFKTRTMALAIIAFVGTSHVSHAVEPQNVATLTGTCKTLVVGGKDRSRGCGRAIIQSAYNDGRIGFHVPTSDGAAAFSGFTAAHPDANTEIVDLDRFILNPAARGPTTQPVSGTCTYSNPYLGPSLIRCEAKDKAGKRYTLLFKTDGSKPKFWDPAGGGFHPR